VTTIRTGQECDKKQVVWTKRSQLRSLVNSRALQSVRVILGACLVCVLCTIHMNGLVHGDEGTWGESSCSSSQSILIRIWIGCGEKTIEYPYVVCPADRVSIAQAKRPSADQCQEWMSLRAEKKRHDEAVYDRIVDRFSLTAAPNRNADLAAALSWIESYKARGYSMEPHITASPDGRYTVFATDWNKPLLLIDVATLTTLRLADEVGDLVTPVAWSPDSRYVAFAPPKNGKMYVYDVAGTAVASTKAGAALWVEAIAWSPDGQRLALIGWRNRRMDKNPFALLAAAAGHPIFRNDAVLSVYTMHGGELFSILLQRGISEQVGRRVRVEWK
jgi:hypothetical protein